VQAQQSHIITFMSYTCIYMDGWIQHKIKVKGRGWF